MGNAPPQRSCAQRLHVRTYAILKMRIAAFSVVLFSFALPAFGMTYKKHRQHLGSSDAKDQQGHAVAEGHWLRDAGGRELQRMGAQRPGVTLSSAWRMRCSNCRRQS